MEPHVFRNVQIAAQAAAMRSAVRLQVAATLLAAFVPGPLNGSAEDPAGADEVLDVYAAWAIRAAERLILANERGA